jgi:hypothetical protein
MERVPQRVLVHELKRAIDLIPRGDPGATKRILHLASENPRSVRSRHVLHNLGSARVATLAGILGEPLRASRAGAPRNNDADHS